MSAKPWTESDLTSLEADARRGDTNSRRWLVTLDAERAKSAELLKALRAVIETRAAYDWAVYVIARDDAVALLKRLK